MEVTRGELTLARIEQHVIQLEGSDQTLTVQLRDITGYPAGQSLHVEPAETMVIPEQSASELSDLALRNSPLIKEAEDDRSARQHILKGDARELLVAQRQLDRRVRSFDQIQ